MKKYLSWFLAIVVAIACGNQSWATDYYINAQSGSDAAAGTSAAPWLTLDRLRPTSYTPAAGDRIFLSGTFRGNAAGTVINKLKLKPAANMYIGQWPGKPQCVIRGDVVPASGSWAGAAGVFTITLPQADQTWGETDGMQDYVASVVQDWDIRIDSLGRHYGHLTRGATAGACTANTYKYFYETSTRLLTIGIGAAETPTTTVIGWCRGNVDGIEIGTPSYESFPAHNSIQSAATLGSYSAPINNFTLDGIHSYLWCDSGKGARSSTISIGYAVRIADGVNCVAKNITTIDSGYHALMFVGDACYGNYWANCVHWGGAPNTSSGNSIGGFYAGPGGGLTPSVSNVDKCIAENIVGYKYWHLDQAGVPLATDSALASTAATTCDGFICHTNSRGLTSGTGTSGGASGDTATASNNRITNSSAYSMYVGDQVYIVDSTATGLTAGAYYVKTAPSATTFTLSSTSGGTETDITADGACHWYSITNRVLDAEFRNCKVYESGKISDSTMCAGSAFVGGGRSRKATNPKDWRSFPVRYVNCVNEGAAFNLLTGAQGDVGFYRCSFKFPRMGSVGYSVSSGGGNLGSSSGDCILNMTSCEVIADASRSGASAYATGSNSGLFYLNFATDLTPNFIYLLYSSFYLTGDRTSSGERWFFTNSNSANSDTADRVFARGCIFGHQWCKTTTATSIGITGLVNNSRASFGDTEDGNVSFNVRDCAYFNMTTDKYIPYSGGTNNLGPEQGGDNYKEWCDTNGVYFGGTTTGNTTQDPTVANINSGYGSKNPFIDTTGKTGLQLNGMGLNYQKFDVSNVPDFGLNNKKFNGRYGCYQDGPDANKYSR